MRRRGRMRARQPDVQRHDAGFRSEGGESKREHRAARRRRQRRCARTEVDKRRRARSRRHDQKHRQQQHETKMRHGRVPEAGRARVARLVLGHHEEVRRNRHQLPRKQECEHVRRARHEAHAEEERIEHQTEEAERSSSVVVGGVREAVDRGEQTDAADEREEERAERVELNRDAAGNGDHVGPHQLEPIPGGENGQRNHEPRDTAGRCADCRRPTRDPIRRRDQRDNRAGQVAGNHEQEGGRTIDRHRAGPGDKRSSAARMPRRMSAGSGGQPAIETSTGMTLSTGPTTA